MKKFIFATLMAVTLTGCTISGDSESALPESENLSLTNSANSSSSLNSTITSSVLSSSTSSSASSSTLSSSPSESAPESSAFPEGFKLSDYVSGFDDVEPMKYTVTAVKDSTCDQAVVDKAIEAYKSSACFSDALEHAYEVFRVENGELIPTADDMDEKYISSYRSIMGEGLLVNDNGEIDISVFVSCSAKLKSGDNSEYIVILSSYAPMEFKEYSGSVIYYPFVYINADGEATVVEVLSRQTLQAVNLIEYSDGTTHLMVYSGHTVGTQHCYIVSFKDGKPNCELSLSSVLCEDGVFFERVDSGLPGFPFFWDGEKYCGVSGVIPSKGLADIICGNKNVLEAVTDPQNEYDEGTLFIIGGKYVAFTKQGVTFVVTDAGFEKSALKVYPSDGHFFTRVEIGDDVFQFDYGEEIKLLSYNTVLN
ncbi:MAG: hypothetical protein K2N38_10385 [Oscillospiraceae bacterium]|nr:hypothetical protein [Oscillospiraceae bacterium]